MTTKSELTLTWRHKPYVLAHRGNKVVCPENTLAAFKRALDDGADILETDIHQTADGVFVCIHDPTVDRTTNGSGAIADMRLDEIKRLSASCGRREFESEQIPTLGDVAEILPNDIGLALELKDDRFLQPEVARQLVDELDKLGVRNRTIVISFSFPRLQALRSVARDTPIGRITVFDVWPHSGAELLGSLWPMLLLNPFFVWIAHRRGQLVCPLDPEPDSRLLLYRALHCDALLTNDSGETCRALCRTGWKQEMRRETNPIA